MGAGHGHRLHFHGHSPVHRAPAHLKVLALLGFMLVVVATPRQAYPAFALGPPSCWASSLLSRVPLRYLLPRMVVEVPFVVFAVLMPFIAHGPRTEVLGVSVSEPGLVAGVALLIKGTIGVLASLTLAATTEPQDLLRGLQRLRTPDLVVQIMGFMIRYLDVVTAELGRMMTALRSRGCDPRSPRHWPVLARSLGALFIRSYERGERVHLAMLSRGYDGRLPQSGIPDDHPRARRARARLRLPRRPPGAVRGRPARPPRRAGRAARAQRCRQDDPRAPPQRHPRRGAGLRRRSAASRSPRST